ncbi:vWA domain-containing protein [Namhaeicola litoreus]|uniref:VWA domain-containing protein n=1 Tax=Namhaeicola litoreus TaxID=1052145 RepID=A0ABW3Y3P9_9FLAO
MILTIFLALLISSVIVYFFYWKTKKQAGSYLWLSSILRGLALFLVLLLIFDPKIEMVSESIEKSNLLVLLDQSSSIQKQNKDSIAASLKDNIQEDKDLNRKFNISFFLFAKNLALSEKDSLEVNGTNIHGAISGLNDLFANNQNAIVLITDGNQNEGVNYIYAPNKIPVYPVILGDTSTSFDISIHKVNVNKYSFKGQKFPVEVFVQYDGKQPIRRAVKIFENKRQIAQEFVDLGPNLGSAIVQFKIESQTVGNHFYSVSVDQIEGEKDLINNASPFSVTVIDESAKVLLLYKQLHPDMGFWKRMIELNQQREVDVASVESFSGELTNYKFVILMGFDSSFNLIYKKLIDNKINHLIETINGTNYNVLSSQNKTISFDESPISITIKVFESNNFSEIDLNPLEFEKYPPLISKIKKVSFKESHEVLWKDELENPILVFQNKNFRSVYLFAENIFQWQTYHGLTGSQKNNFEDYFDGIIQFLQFQYNDQVVLDYPKIVFKDEKIVISLKVFDANFNLSTNDDMILNIISENDTSERKLPMIFKNNKYQSNFFLAPGKYNFKIQRNGNLEKTGSFQVLDFSAEDRETASNFKDLNQLAIHTKGELFMPYQLDSLKSILLKSNSFKPILSEEKEEQSFIDIKWILGLIALSLTLDWFLRKSQGFY